MFSDDLQIIFIKPMPMFSFFDSKNLNSNILGLSL